MDNNDALNTFSIDLETNGLAVVNAMHYGTCITVTNHIGNFNFLKELVRNTVSNRSITSFQSSSQYSKSLHKSKRNERLTDEHYIKRFLYLIDFCFNVLKKTFDLKNYYDNEYFEVIDHH